MTGNSDHIDTAANIVAWLGGLLMGFVASEEMRVRYAIAKAASRARARQPQSRAE